MARRLTTSGCLPRLGLAVHSWSRPPVPQATAFIRIGSSSVSQAITVLLSRGLGSVRILCCHRPQLGLAPVSWWPASVPRGTKCPPRGTATVACGCPGSNPGTRGTASTGSLASPLLVMPSPPRDLLGTEAEGGGDLVSPWARKNKKVPWAGAPAETQRGRRVSSPAARAPYGSSARASIGLDIKKVAY